MLRIRALLTAIYNFLSTTTHVPAGLERSWNEQFEFWRQNVRQKKGVWSDRDPRLCAGVRPEQSDRIVELIEKIGVKQNFRTGGEF